MRLAKLRIQNLRSVADATIEFDDYTCLVGPNGAGKSTVLTALNILFRNATDSPLDLLKLTDEDFHNKDTTVPITVTATFSDLGPDAEGDFQHYVRQGSLVISARATWDPATKQAPVRQLGQRMVMKDFGPFFKASEEGKPVADLKSIYTGIRTRYGDLPAPGTKAAMTDALRKFEEEHPDVCSLEESEHEFYGVSKGTNLLQKYIQWVYVPAVKDASVEQVEGKKTAFGLLLERVVRTKVSFDEPLAGIRAEAQKQYAKVLQDHAKELTDLSDALKVRIQQWAHPDAALDVRWYENPTAIRVEVPVAQLFAGEGDFLGSISRCGHGLQRSYLLALLQELACSDGSQAPKLILGCEEPELYQHPPQQRHLADVLEKLSDGNAQVFVCTHSPHFVSGRGFEGVRMVRKDRTTHATQIKGLTFAELAKTLGKIRGEVVRPTSLPAGMHQFLQPSVNEMFFSPVVVLVEGLEDVAYLSSYLVLSGKWEEYRRLGCHIVPVEGKNKLVEAIAVASHLEIPTFAVCDGDTHKTKPGEPEKHRKDNEAIQKLLGVVAVDGLPKNTVWGDNLVMWSTEIGEVVYAEIGDDKIDGLREKVMNEQKLHGGGSLKKNRMFIGYLLSEAWALGIRCPSLENACDRILNFARASNAAKAAVAA